jgi:3-hydroxyisobutyrate dehydrogenase
VDVIRKVEIMTSQARLGFIGLGHLGSRIARRLVTAGFPMTVYNRDREKTKSWRLSAPMSLQIRENWLTASTTWVCLASPTELL